MDRTTHYSDCLSFSRPLWAEIDLGALLHNVRQLRNRNHTLILPVLKANAYGHGARACAEALQSHMQKGEMFCVASVDEGIYLRNHGITLPILLLSALLPSEAEACIEHALTATISSIEFANALSIAAVKQNKIATAHMKIDSGMGRLGVAPHRAFDVWNTAQHLPHLQINGIFTHFACADEEHDAMTEMQCHLFKETLQQCNLTPKLTAKTHYSSFLIHAANSAATWRYPETAFDAVRPGIAIYGVSPFTSKVLCAGVHEELIPVMTLRAKITFIKELSAGASASYGATWKCQKPTKLAVIPCGYADGYHRILSNRGKVLLRGQLCPVVGRVTMDQILVDVTDIEPAVNVGEDVILWGKGLPVEYTAALADTIGYELLTGVTARVPRIYQQIHQQNKPSNE